MAVTMNSPIPLRPDPGALAHADRRSFMRAAAAAFVGHLPILRRHQRRPRFNRYFNSDSHPSRVRVALLGSGLYRDCASLR